MPFPSKSLAHQLHRQPGSSSYGSRRHNGLFRSRTTPKSSENQPGFYHHKTSSCVDLRSYASSHYSPGPSSSNSIGCSDEFSAIPLTCNNTHDQLQPTTHDITSAELNTVRGIILNNPEIRGQPLTPAARCLVEFLEHNPQFKEILVSPAIPNYSIPLVSSYTIPSDCMDWDRSEFRVCLQQSLRRVIKSLSDSRSTFGTVLQDHLASIRNLVEYTSNWSWCVDYVIPLVYLTYNSEPNYVEAFDEACTTLRAMADYDEMTHELSEQYLDEVLPLLIRANFEVSVYSQIAFETVLHVLAYFRPNHETVKLIAETRTNDPSRFYAEDRAFFRSMRAEYLKLVLYNAMKARVLFECDSGVEESCLNEIKASLFRETSRVVRKRYKEVLRQVMSVLPEDHEVVECLKNMTPRSTHLAAAKHRILTTLNTAFQRHSPSY
ncbi:hypothetical protein TRVA0_019S01750 [Trichomonascus vanleenenianus]|uniref:uncharacterized protein n=1 Tax=Trichomonascus vanleenenianus TaxID=2268995 RepID=UPI003ECA93C9